MVDPRCDRVQIRASQGGFSMINIIDYPYFPMIARLDRAHPASRGIDAIVMPFVSPVVTVENKPGLTYTPIALTSNASYLDEHPYIVSPLEERPRPDNAPAGPFRAAVLVEGKFPGGTKPGRLMVFGTSRFIASEYPTHPSNYSMFLNFVDWSAQDDILLRIRSKGFTRRPLRPMPDALRLALKYFMTAFPALACLFAGLIVWRRQRVRRALLPLRYREA
ncbi:MAG: hypothetical protein JO102_06710 [Elusimicrobia bacterium]|nr:hypothetical protein [Elusimicrobiota bacterium]